MMARSTNKPRDNEERKWKIEDAIRILKRAEDIKNDKSLMTEVKKSIAELNTVISKK
jgi:ribosomal protein L29